MEQREQQRVRGPRVLRASAGCYGAMLQGVDSSSKYVRVRVRARVCVRQPDRELRTLRAISSTSVVPAICSLGKGQPESRVSVHTHSWSATRDSGTHSQAATQTATEAPYAQVPWPLGAGATSACTGYWSGA